MPVSGPPETATTRHSGCRGAARRPARRRPRRRAAAGRGGWRGPRAPPRSGRRRRPPPEWAAPGSLSSSRAVRSVGTGVPSGSVSRARSTPSGYSTCRASSSASAVRPDPGLPAMSSTRAGCPAAREGVQARALDVDPEFLHSRAAQELTLRRSGPGSRAPPRRRHLRAVCVHRLIRHGPAPSHCARKPAGLRFGIFQSPASLRSATIRRQHAGRPHRISRS